MRSNLTVRELKNAAVAVLGFGRSGRNVTEYLLSLGITPTVYTGNPVAEDIQQRYTANGVRFTAPWPEVLAEDILMRSPGIRPDLPAIRRACARGAHLSGECDLFLDLCPSTVIGVTGSDGKTTTANMVAALLRAAGHRVLLGGNNGGALLPHLHSLTTADFAVVELSSFQLMTVPAPDIAVLTNLTPNHLNWHADYEEYAAAKCRIYQGATHLVTNAACAATAEIGCRAALPVTWFCNAPKMPFTPKTGQDFLLSDGVMIRWPHTGCALPAFADFPLHGAHNRENFLAAVAAAAPFLDEAAILAAARDFRGVPHRLQTVATIDGVTFINSSIDTSPTRTAAALSALDAPPIVIAGGKGKGISLAPLADALAARAKAVFLYGETACEIEFFLQNRIPLGRFFAFRDAFFAAARAARAGDTVLLSPGCTAFDQFRDFEERGEVFCRLVGALAKGG